jgi:hypothetical protein
MEDPSPSAAELMSGTPAPLDLPAAADHVERDRRAYARLAAADASWLSRVRLRHGPPLSLVDVSAGGVQVEVEDYRLKPGATVVLEIAGRATDLVMPSRVIRCQVSSITPSILYRSALAFRRPIKVPAASTPGTPARATGAPVLEHARLMTALKGQGIVPADSPVVLASGSGTGGAFDGLALALALIESPAGHRAGPIFARQLAALFAEMRAGVEAGDNAQALVTRLVEHLRRVLPVRTIRVVDAASAGPDIGPDVIYFDTTGADLPAKLLVEFARGCRPFEWHFQILKAAVQMIGLAREVDSRRRAAAPPAADWTTESPAGWAKLVVRYADGRLLKGYSQDFHPGKGHFQLAASPTLSDGARIVVPIGDLKAVFFVRDFDGNALYKEDKAAERRGHGRHVSVTFLDDEVMEGTTLNYQPGGVGFFLAPFDRQSNNLRTFVVARAVRHLQFA